MKKRTDIKTRTYEAGFEDFMIDIVETADMYEAYIYRSNYGTRTMMWGSMKESTTFREYKELIEANLLEYMYFYDKDMAEQEEVFMQKLMEEKTS